MFNDKRHPKDMEEEKVSNFLTHLTVVRNVTSSTQNLTLCSIVFYVQACISKGVNIIGGHN